MKKDFSLRNMMLYGVAGSGLSLLVQVFTLEDFPIASAVFASLFVIAALYFHIRAKASQPPMSLYGPQDLHKPDYYDKLIKKMPPTLAFLKKKPHKHFFPLNEVRNLDIDPRCVGCGMTLSEASKIAEGALRKS